MRSNRYKNRYTQQEMFQENCIDDTELKTQN